MNQAINVARQPDKHAEVGDRFDLAFDLVALIVTCRELVPWISTALLHTQGNTTALAINLKHHHFDFVAHLNDFSWVHVLVSPVHF